MKELSIEEKAKAYDEALERAKKVHKYSSDLAEIKRIEHIFPELKESEDEKIRQALVNYFDDANKVDENPLQSYGIYTDKAIAWLEKLKMFTEHDEGLYYFANSEFTYVGNPTSDDGSVLEKQAEQKKFIDNLTPQEAMDIAVAKCFDEQKPTDKTEPKFKVGDWILYSGDHYEGVRYITKIDENGYYIERNGLPHGIIPFNHEICMRLWTIQDAKDGDVLVNGSNIFIFHFINDTRLMGYCHINTDDGRFYDDIGKNECFCLIDAVVNPTTKEQRDTLFAKMRKAGYEWDAYKKELKLLVTNGGDF